MSVRVENDLLQIKQIVIDMIKITTHQYEDMLLSIQKNDFELAQAVIKMDETINRMEEAFIDVSLWKIAKQQMVASDLRRAVGFISIVREVERIADYAKNVCRYFIKYMPSNKLVHYLEELVAKVIEMLSEVSKIFEEEKIELAYNMPKYDVELDRIFKKENNELIEKIRDVKTKEEIKVITSTMQQLKYIERAGLHIISITELLIFIIEGRTYDLETPI
ncbi:phosphate signaling complex protein PhoU [Spiroplasma chrysopicola]|uniref:Phosphate transport system regulator PhoU n=1 Tax=Spiroplasma chrysopicola DF-1 TaxID=1276227 RepID=R4UAB6_9MOLU|nr:phosphate signaling complex protein PhoU [Spiroplasma chrysopicola]AGM24854.1 phosphate transport system regulator PhoU [Spiroplasma chrysopicola DF-1]